MWNKRVNARLILIFSTNKTAKAWPVDPFVFTSFKQGVSEKLPQANAQYINAIQLMDNLNQDDML